MKKISIFLVLFLVIISMSACTDPNGAIKTLEANGYKNIQITGYRFFAGSESDWYATGFIAEAQNGKTVTGTVTKGFLFKGSTIRLD